MTTHTSEIVIASPLTKQRRLTVGDAVWVGMADMQRRSGSDKPFSTEAIVQVVQDLKLTDGAFKSIWQHVSQHCVANRKPNPNRARMLFATGQGDRRLYRDGDPFDPGREGAPTHPDWQNLPPEYAYLRTWYEKEWNIRAAAKEADPLVALIGSGKDVWATEHADEYVTHIRTNWEGAR